MKLESGNISQSCQTHKHHVNNPEPLLKRDKPQNQSFQTENRGLRQLGHGLTTNEQQPTQRRRRPTVQRTGHSLPQNYYPPQQDQAKQQQGEKEYRAQNGNEPGRGQLLI